MSTWKPTKAQAIQAAMSVLIDTKGGATISDFVDPFGRGCLSASEARRALGWLYGRGRAKVVEVRGGEEVWTLTSTNERLAM